MSAIFGEVLTFGEKDGNEVKLRVFGDEHYARYETVDGFTAVYDSEYGKYCYARIAAGALRSTGVFVTEPPPARLEPHLKESPEVVQSRAEARRMRRAAVAGGRPRDAVVRVFGPNQGLLAGRVLSSGSVTGLTILVNFRDVTSTVTKDDVDALLNADDYTRNGNVCSAREYFRRVSSGKLDYRNVVVGPYTLSRNRAFYVNNLLVEEALGLAVDDGLDLTRFDSRDEGIVDALNVMYAGQTQYNGDLWPHNWHIDLQFGGVSTDLYLLTSLGRTPRDLSIGTFCHENGHLLCRFPDMYDYGERDGDNAPSAGIGSYCLMGSGNHLDSGRSPSPVCSYLRDLAGWCDNEVDLSPAGSYDVTHGDYNTVFKYRTTKPNEYFLVENRSQLGLDRALPASGLAVYHCDIFGSNELQDGTPSRHYQCALLQADGRRDLEQDPENQGDATDLFDGTAGVVLSSTSNPHSRAWDGSVSGLVMTDISPPGETISFAAGDGGPG
ncbi:MAG: M6 family metalloprotease domain-containing protein [Acidimicrobiales bacterium]